MSSQDPTRVTPPDPAPTPPDQRPLAITIAVVVVVVATAAAFWLGVTSTTPPVAAMAGTAVIAWVIIKRRR